MNSLNPLLFQNNMQAEESLMGYVLRLSNMNGLHGNYWIYKLLGRDRLQRFKREDVPALSRIFGESNPKLDNAMSRKRFIDGQFFYEIHGHVFSKSYFIRPAHPQLCPLCLMDTNYASSLWDISLYSVCTTHHCELLDQCPKCHKRIQWNRPLLLTCNCGHPWHERLSSTLNNTDPALLFANLIHHHFNDSLSRQAFKDKFDECLAVLSIDTLCQLIWLFGIKICPADAITTGVSKKVLQTKSAADCCRRGYIRLKEVFTNSSNLLPEIHLPSLERLSEEVSSPADVSFVQQVLLCLELSPERVKLKNHFFSKQLNLF
jgi:hypothetical protein